VQDGCDNRCSYCKVSIVRGPSRSREIPDIIKEVKAILASGFKEIVLTGICLGDFRIDQAGRSLETLVGKLLEIPQDYRIRLSSIEPQYSRRRDHPYDARGDDRLCPHLHIPLQRRFDRILKLMNRKYDARGFAGIVDMARTYVPDIAFTTDIITGSG
jgi:threonylcarbamoyladenosine tRNA methylthiotransferase MtaB